MASGKTDELKGRVKEAAGALTGDEKLKRVRAFVFPCEQPRSGRRPRLLVTLKASTQAGLTGFRGSLLRRIVVGRTRAAQERALTGVKAVLERQ